MICYPNKHFYLYQNKLILVRLFYKEAKTQRKGRLAHSNTLHKRHCGAPPTPGQKIEMHKSENKCNRVGLNKYAMRNDLPKYL